VRDHAVAGWALWQEFEQLDVLPDLGAWTATGAPELKKCCTDREYGDHDLPEGVPIHECECSGVAAFGAAGRAGRCRPEVASRPAVAGLRAACGAP